MRSQPDHLPSLATASHPRAKSALISLARILARQAAREAFASSQATVGDPFCDAAASKVAPLATATKCPEEPVKKEFPP